MSQKTSREGTWRCFTGSLFLNSDTLFPSLSIQVENTILPIPCANLHKEHFAMNNDFCFLLNNGVTSICQGDRYEKVKGFCENLVLVNYLYREGSRLLKFLPVKTVTPVIWIQLLYIIR